MSNKQQQAQTLKKKDKNYCRVQHFLNCIERLSSTSISHFENLLEYFENKSLDLNKVQISYNHFEKIEMIIDGFLKLNKNEKCLNAFNILFKSSWFNTQLIEICILIIEQANHIQYLEQLIEKIYGILYSVFSMIPDSVVNSQISSIFLMQKSIEQQFPNRQNNTLYNAYDKFLLEIYTNCSRLDYKSIQTYPISLEFIYFLNNYQNLFGEVEKLETQNTSLHQYLNYHFKILRMDFINNFRKALSSLNETGFLSNINKNCTQFVHLFQNIELVSTEINNYEIIWGITIKQFNLDGRKTQKIDWERSKKLRQGSLICLTTLNCFPQIFGIITKREQNQPLYDQNKKIFLEFKFIDPSQSLIAYFNLFTQCNVLISYDGLVQPTIYYLESIKQIDDIPFKSIIVNNKKIISTPQYVKKKREYQIDLKGDVQNFSGKYIDITSNVWPKLPTSLDESQIEAIKFMLQNDLAIIQGPPGSGKSYCTALAVRQMLENIKKDNFPILIVCYSNHALDQFLEHLLAFIPTDDIARLGGQCKNEKLRDCILKVKCKQFQFGWDRFRTVQNKLQKIIERMLNYNYQIGDTSIQKFWIKLYDRILFCFINDNCLLLEQFDENNFSYIVNCWLDAQIPEEEVLKTLKQFNGCNKYFQDQTIINNQTPKQFDIQQGEDSSSDEDLDNFLDSDDEVIDDCNYQHIKTFNKLDLQESIKIFNNNNCTNQNSWHYNYEGIDQIKRLINQDLNPWHLSMQDINEIKKFIRCLAYQTDSQKYNNYYQEFKNLQQNLRKIYDDKEIEILNSKKIIGVTVTGVARQVKKLQELNTKIMIIEEAAEVLESHMVSILTKNLQHLILIGDHKQLRPFLKCYDLEKKYAANISLFERLINNELPYRILKQQRRMKTKFADFIRLIYGDCYQDHSIIQEKNKIVINGLKKDLLFFNHNWPEAENEFSKFNIKEAEMIVYFVQFLLKNEYKQSQITVLTFYLYQAQVLKNRFLNSQLKFIKIQTVDNYQGEENDIVIVSLVRNNTNGQLGFINVENRINVALSRAKIGLYVFGNFQFIYDSSGTGSLWQKIINLAKQKKCLKNYISIQLQNGQFQKIYQPEELFQVLRYNKTQIEKTKINFSQSQEKMKISVTIIVQINSGKVCLNKQTLIYNSNKNKQQNSQQIQVDKQFTFNLCSSCQNFISKQNLKIKYQQNISIGAQLINTQFINLNLGKCKNFNCELEKMVEAVENESKLSNYEINNQKQEKQDGNKFSDSDLISNLNKIYIPEFKCYGCRDQKFLFYEKSNFNQFQFEGCNQIIKYQLSCGHLLKMKCCDAKLQLEKYHCSQPCLKQTSCGHSSQCLNKCSEPCTPCNEIIERKLNCGHSIYVNCFQSGQIFQCQKLCSTQRECEHKSQCQNKCGEECSPCREQIYHTLNCGHSVLISCFQRKTIQLNYYCQEPCQKFSPCQHISCCQLKCFEKCSPCLFTITQQLDCGHYFNASCYNFREELLKYQCPGACNKIRGCGHFNPCFNKCYEICTPCLEIIETKLGCGHLIQQRCDQYNRNAKCEQPCNKKRQCAHPNQCQNLCGEDCSLCTETICKELNCGHYITIECFQQNYDLSDYECQQLCQKLRECGHNYPCEYRCSDYHICSPCKQLIIQNLDCGHQTEIECDKIYQNLSLNCYEPCNKQRWCGHSYPCQNRCGEECSPCMEIIEADLFCGHIIQQTCSEYNPKQICNKSCNKKRSCGHNSKCLNKCIEQCSPCMDQIQISLLCGHYLNIECSKKLEFDFSDYLCKELCIKQRECGHQYPCEYQCSNHEICSPCNNLMNYQYDCGHNLEIACFKLTNQETNQFCIQPCNKQRQCGHQIPCLNLCFEECSHCLEIVETKLNCGHTIKQQCYKTKEEILCEKSQDTNVICSHSPKYLNNFYETWNSNSPHQLIDIELEKDQVEDINNNLPSLQPIDQQQLERFPTLINYYEQQDQKTLTSQQNLIQSKQISKQQDTQMVLQICDWKNSKFQCIHQSKPDCDEIIEYELPCGHTEKFMCSTAKYQSQSFICRANCIRQRPCDHNFPCTNMCFESCSPCEEVIEIKLRCGHIFEQLCYGPVYGEKYSQPRKAKCGHECSKVCEKISGKCNLCQL